MTDKNEDSFFVGYADTPQQDRRFFMRAGVGLMLGTGAIAGAAAALQRSPGPGAWDMADVRDWTGVLTTEPYPMLRVAGDDGKPRNALLACSGKCGVANLISDKHGQTVRIRGSLIHRGDNAMIAVPETEIDWIETVDETPLPELAFPTPQPIGEVDLAGEILDSKCWFGAMRPSEGKVHKACAALCIRGGIPPAFYAKDTSGRSALMIMTSNGSAHFEDILPYVADPVRVRGQVSDWGGMWLLDAPVSAIKRI